jgi:hypothetical protein
MVRDHRSAQLARLVGPTLVAISTTESLNAHIWATSNAPTVFLNGSVIFVSGLAIIQSHNIWRFRWPLVITLVGWGSLAIGLARMAFPEFVLKQVRSGGAKNVRFTAAMVSLIGAFLTAKGYLGSSLHSP